MPDESFIILLRCRRLPGKTIAWIATRPFWTNRLWIDGIQIFAGPVMFILRIFNSARLSTCIGLKITFVEQASNTKLDCLFVIDECKRRCLPWPDRGTRSAPNAG